MTASAGQSEGVLIGELEAAAVGPVEGPGVVSLVTHWERPGAGSLANKVHQIACMINGEIANVGVVGCFGPRRVVYGRLS